MNKMYRDQTNCGESLKLDVQNNKGDVDYVRDPESDEEDEITHQ